MTDIELYLALAVTVLAMAFAVGCVLMTGSVKHRDSMINQRVDDAAERVKRLEERAITAR